ncbi:MAG TPA: hypothetical protein VJH70_02680 [Candidatus Paceibacterota bacterium]
MKWRLIWRVGITFAALMIVSISVYKWANATFVPALFQDARVESVRISKDIVNLLEESLRNLEIISQADRDYNFSAALDLVYKELERIRIAKDRAKELTDQLNVMAKAIAQITPIKAKNIALEAVSTEVSLLSHLVIYNDTLNSLLETLRYKFSGDIRYDAEDVQKLVSGLNQQAQDINSLNDQFNQKIGEFDALVE